MVGMQRWEDDSHGNTRAATKILAKMYHSLASSRHFLPLTTLAICVDNVKEADGTFVRLVDIAFPVPLIDWQKSGLNVRTLETESSRESSEGKRRS
ncbi:hypothetical protein KM043_013593 [Ampulex compressa]|nr:hypothetical protein KM043_013593 [Ampulex compressa]